MARGVVLEEKHHALIRRLWIDECLSDNAISKRLAAEENIHVDYSRIANARRAMGLLSDDPVRKKRQKEMRKASIPPEHLEMIRTWYAEGFGDVAIMNRFWREHKADYSRLAIERMRLDMGLSKNEGALQRRGKPNCSSTSMPALRPSRDVLAPIRGPAVFKPAPEVSAAPVRKQQFILPPGRVAVSFADVKDGCCRWPYDDSEGGVLFCGRKVRAAAGGRTHSYCQEHFEVAVNLVYNARSQKMEKPSQLPADIKIGEKVA